MPPPADAASLAREVLTWLASDQPALSASALSWQPGRWSALPAFLHQHGVAGWLFTRLPGTRLQFQLPGSVMSRLAEQHELASRRMFAFEKDLAAILESSAQAGFPLLPLKGSLLTAGGWYYPSAARPMADLDLLVPEPFAGSARRVLETLGYRWQPSPSLYSRHDRFVLPGSTRVVDPGSEHPDNPRPVELHTSLARPLWGDVGAADLTPVIWHNATPGRLLGCPAWIPSPDALLAHLSLHSFHNFLTYIGRLINWLDLVIVAEKAAGIGALPFPDQTYPALCLADRAFPGRIPAEDLHTLSKRAQLAVRRWAQQVPLDQRCGLMLDSPSTRTAWRRHWDRWQPRPWRLALAYNQPSRPAPYPVALGLHLAAAWRHWRSAPKKPAG